jgi:hypothetical protein
MLSNCQRIKNGLCVGCVSWLSTGLGISSSFSLSLSLFCLCYFFFFLILVCLFSCVRVLYFRNWNGDWVVVSLEGSRLCLTESQSFQGVLPSQPSHFLCDGAREILSLKITRGRKTRVQSIMPKYKMPKPNTQRCPSLQHNERHPVAESHTSHA